MNRWTKKELLEDKFHDYGTSNVNLSIGDVIDTSTTGVSDYDDYLTKDGSKYLLNKKGTFGEIVQMSPKEYYEACSEYVFDSSVSDLKQSRSEDKEQIEYLKSVLTDKKKKFPLPYINKAEGWQEGLHRMMAIGELFGWNHKVPVLIIDFVDGDTGRQNYEKKIHDEHTSAEIRKAVNDALEYKFKDIKEFKDELVYQFDDDEFDVTTDNNYIYVTRDGVTGKFDIDRLQLVEKESDDLDNLSDDILLDDELDDFMQNLV